MKNIKGRGNYLRGGGVKRGLTVFTFDVHFMNVFIISYLFETKEHI